MRIALAHELGPKGEERVEAIAPVVDALESAGLDVTLVDVSGRASAAALHVEAAHADLVLSAGDVDEAFVAAVAERLGVAHVGSTAATAAVVGDRHLARLVAVANGIPTPRWTLVTDVESLVVRDALLPAIVAPRSSRAPFPDAPIASAKEVTARVRELLASSPDGVLVEAWAPGRDVVLGWVATIGELGGILAPPGIDGALVARARPLAAKVVKALGLRDVAEIRLRVSDANDVAFVDARASTLLLAGSPVYAAARSAGVTKQDDLVVGIVAAAAERAGLAMPSRPRKNGRKQPPLRVGFTYNVKRIVARRATDDDSEAEFDAPSTIGSIQEALASLGHEVVALEANADLPSIVASDAVDVVFNIAEGMRGRNREAQVPALLELLDIEYTGSDPTALSLTLDKALAKRVVAQAGVRTPKFATLTTADEPLPSELAFPVIVKPVAEGSSKGVLRTSVAETEGELRALAREITQKYRQQALVEEYVGGREFTVALLGSEPRVLPPMEIVFARPTAKRTVYSFEHKLSWSDEIRYESPAKVDEELDAELRRVAKAAFDALGCRDVARIDLRCDAAGNVHFLECNPLPGLTPDWSDLCLIAKGVGMDYRALIGEILGPAIRRHRAKARARSTVLRR